MKIINLTPHSLNVWNEKTQKFTSFESDGSVRLNHTNEPIGEIDGIPLYSTKVTSRNKLPPVLEGVVYIVSAVVRSAFKERDDFWQPGRLIRDENKDVIGCIGLSQ